VLCLPLLEIQVYCPSYVNLLNTHFQICLNWIALLSCLSLFTDRRYKDFVKVIHGKRKMFACELCNYRSEHLLGAHAHARRHVRSITCPKCAEIIIDRKEFEAHIAQPHPNSKLKCQTCKKECSSLSSLQTHIRSSHRPIKCAHCPELVIRKLMGKHMREFHAIKLPSCGVCGFVSTEQHRVNKHQKVVHLKEKNVECSICKFKFFGMFSLKRHMVKHKPDKSFECGFCKKQFVRKSTLTLHEKIHTGKKDKVCEACGVGFVQKASLNYHMIKHHPDRV
jgi:KRAB domain-containing zinc finger protein